MIYELLWIFLYWIWFLQIKKIFILFCFFIKNKWIYYFGPNYKKHRFTLRCIICQFFYTLNLFNLLWKLSFILHASKYIYSPINHTSTFIGRKNIISSTVSVQCLNITITFYGIFIIKFKFMILLIKLSNLPFFILILIK